MPKTHSATFEVPVEGAAFEAALEGLTRVNEGLMQSGEIPRLYEAGVSYRDEPRDIWRHCAHVAEQRWGDCEDLSAYRAAELRVSGEDPGARVSIYQSAPHRYHAVVMHGDGSMEDPSRVCGMGAPKASKAASMPNIRHRSMNIMGADPMPNDPRQISFEVVEVPGSRAAWGRPGKPRGYRGFIRVPLGFDLPHAATGTSIPQALVTLGPEKATVQAAQQAAAAVAKQGANKVSQVLTNPAVQLALSQVPGGSAAATLLASPTVQNGIKSAVSALKFW